jgi:TonB family protein
MKTFQTSEESKRIATRSQHSEFEFRPLPNPSKAARLSLLPGLGQFYNGQKRKGALFLAAALASCLLLLAVSSGQTILNFLAPIASLLNLKLNAAIANNMVVSPWVVLISWCLYLSFVAYAVRDAYDHADFMRKRAAAPRFMIGLAETASGSYLAHFAIIACFLIAILFLLTPKPPAQQITDIELMPQPQAHKSPLPKNNPAPKAEPKPEPPKQITPPPPKPEPPKPVVAPPVKAPPIPIAPISVKSNTPSPNTVPVAPSAPAPSSSSGQPTGTSGSGQSTGEDSGDDQDIDFGPYLAAMQRRIKKAWFPPKGNESKRVTLKFDIQRDGSVTNVRLQASSGVQVVDDAAIQAVQNAAPFAPLPKGSPDELDIKFTFDYNVFNGTSRGAFHQF